MATGAKEGGRCQAESGRWIEIEDWSRGEGPERRHKNALNDAELKENNRKQDEKILKAKLKADLAAAQKKKEDEKKQKEAEIKTALRERMAKAGYHNRDIEATIEAKEMHYCHTLN
jgi:hypothetical protein